MRCRPSALIAGAALSGLACAAGPPPSPPMVQPASPPPADGSAAGTGHPRTPVLAPEAARALGLLPRRAVGAEQFIRSHPTFDGRGVLIAILDSGVDAGLPGLRYTTTRAPKLLDLRDFSGEGRVLLDTIVPAGDTVVVHGQILRGFGRVARLSLGPYYGGVLVERSLGALPAADVNGDGDRDDRLPLVVAKATDGWFVMADTDGDGSLAGEQAIRDYAQAGTTFSYGPLTIAANFASPGRGTPQLDLFFDTSGHGTHVAGIAAGHNLFGVDGFDGLAPGARILGLKIANNARGGVTVSGSILRAIEHATAVADAHDLPVVINVSYGIGNELEAGRAVLDSLLDAFLLAHPEVVLVISAGNDGPGISTVGFPGSADFALTACALFPGVFAQAPNPARPPVEDVVGWWSARGGGLAKPDLCVPGVAFSNVPPWNTGEEVAGGTSMAAPQLTGVVALLQSALAASGEPVDAPQLAAALAATATPIPGATVLDAGSGVPSVPAAYRWLRAGHRASRYAVRALPDGANTGRSAAYRRARLAPEDSVQRFTITPIGAAPSRRMLLRPDAEWLAAPEILDVAHGPVTVTVRYDTRTLTAPGLYVGTVWARPADDTLAGAAFGLTNTVIVPHTLDAPLRARRYVPAGRSARFFVAVPDGAGTLAARVSVADPEQAVSAYLFGPTGRPHRDGAPLEVGGQLPAAGELQVRAEDLEPGIHELVLVAPPTRDVTADIEMGVAPLAVGAVEPGSVWIRNRGADTLEATVTIRSLGAGRRVRVAGTGGAPRRVSLDVPGWATAVQMEVRLPADVWRRLTDVGLAVWDDEGFLVGEAPLNYAAGRYQVDLAAGAPDRVAIELMPGFALPRDSMPWTADLAVAFLGDTHVTPAVTVGTRVGGGDSAAVAWPAALSHRADDGLWRYVEVEALAPGGTPAIRRALLERFDGAR